MLLRKVYVLFLSFFMLSPVFADQMIQNDYFQISTSLNGITSLKRTNGKFDTEFIFPEKTLGEVIIRYRLDESDFRAVNTIDPVSSNRIAFQLDKIKNKIQIARILENNINLTQKFELQNEKLIWQLEFENITEKQIEIGDIALPVIMNTKYQWDPNYTFTKTVFKHHFISGHGSFVYWMPVAGTGDFLVMTPDDNTKLEFYTETHTDYAWGKGQFVAYIHSAVTGEDTKGSWRQPHTSVTLQPGQKIKYGFCFEWAKSFEDVRRVLYENNAFDVQVVPGMVIPSDLFAQFSLHTKNKIDDVQPEFPSQTVVTYLGEKRKDVHVYKVVFRKLGENKITVRYDSGKYTLLEFFVTEPLETIIKKRAAFIVNNQQHRDKSKWYNGLFSLWDTRMPEGKNKLGPDNRAGQHPYAVSGSDDPSNCKCLYVSEKNVVYPDRNEIEALEYFLENFVWGKHQRTDREEPYPYGIYGVDNWYANRFTDRDPMDKQISRPGGPSQCKMWRTFDYTTYFALYYNMYRIAKYYPDMVTYLDAAGYLERAFGTAKAFFEVPANIRMEGGWSFTGWVYWQYMIGNFHEKYLLGIIEALEETGQQKKADYLRGEWEKKVKYFLYDDPYPYTSEMPVDSTAYESSYAIAKYALLNELKPDEKLWYNRNLDKWYSHPKIKPDVAKEFMERQLLANLACRGWLETSYYHLGSDFRALGSSGYCLSYMSQMGGWAILDYGLYFADKPTDYIELGYASLLSSWALMNTGTRQSNYGFWYPGKKHDGCVGWAFMPQKTGSEWNPACQNIPRGPWPVDGEIDHGLTAGVEAACTVVTDDPIFGLFAYGGVVTENNSEFSIIPKDGVRQRLHLIINDRKVNLLLERDGFAKEKSVIIKKSFERISFNLENRFRKSHRTVLLLSGIKGNINVEGIDSEIEKEKNDFVKIILNVGRLEEYKINISVR